MTDSQHLPRTHRRVRPEASEVFNTLPAQARRDRPETFTKQVSAPNTAHGCGSGGEQPSAEVIAHMVLALSRYLRQLSADGYLRQLSADGYLRQLSADGGHVSAQ